MFKCEFSTDNAAFDPDMGAEVRDILRGVASQLDANPHRTDGVVHDSNGNKIGEWSLTED